MFQTIEARKDMTLDDIYAEAAEMEQRLSSLLEKADVACAEAKATESREAWDAYHVTAQDLTTYWVGVELAGYHVSYDPSVNQLSVNVPAHVVESRGAQA